MLEAIQDDDYGAVALEAFLSSASFSGSPEPVEPEDPGMGGVAYPLVICYIAIENHHL